MPFYQNLNDHTMQSMILNCHVKKSTEIEFIDFKCNQIFLHIHVQLIILILVQVHKLNQTLPNHI